MEFSLGKKTGSASPILAGYSLATAKTSGCRVCLSVCVSPLFLMFHDGITSERFELLS